MKNEIKQIVHLKKQVAVGSVSLRETQYEIAVYGDTFNLRIIEPDGTASVVPLSDRCNRLDLISTCIENDSTGNFLLNFVFDFDQEGQNMLIRYLCDAVDPVDTFPALTLRELHQFARIESAVGGDYHHDFWKSYGFNDAHHALMTIEFEEEFFQSEKSGDQNLLALKDVDVSFARILATRIEFETKSADELRELRFTVDNTLLPFVYGALCNHLTDISEEREQIGNRRELDLRQRVDHIEWLYQAMKPHLTKELVSTERAAILAWDMPCIREGEMSFDQVWDMRWFGFLGMAPLEKVILLGGLYRAGAGLLTEDLISTERAVILASEMEPMRKVAVLGALYGAGARHLTPELILTERAAILASGMDGSYNEQAVKSLNLAGANSLASEPISTERAAILESELEYEDKKFAVVALYCAGARSLTAEVISTESAAILAPSFYLEPALAAILTSALYYAGANSLTPELIATERDMIRASAIDDQYKATAVIGLYYAGYRNLTEELVLLEIDVIRESVPGHYLAEFLQRLYRAGAVHLTTERLSTEIDMVWASAMSDSDKVQSVSELYCAGSNQLTATLISNERERILGSALFDNDKVESLRRLYSAGAMHLTPELISTERVAILESVVGEIDSDSDVSDIDVEVENYGLNAASLMVLYRAGAVHLEQALISTERDAIRASEMDDEGKEIAVTTLYRAWAVHLTAARISAESAAILESEMSDTDKATAFKELYRAGAPHLTKELIFAQKVAIGASNMAEVYKWTVAIDLDTAATPIASKPNQPQLWDSRLKSGDWGR